MGRGNKGSGGGDDDVKREKPLQAVLLADSFTNAFRPISLEMPKVLFPLAGAPLLAYSLEALAANDVKQVFVVCISHASQIEAYIASSGWGERLNIEVVTSTVCTSAGDVMRELDTMGKIDSDPFVLVSGDVVSNLDLRPAMEKHKERRKKSTENIMTMLFRKTGKHARTRPLQDDLVLGVDDATSQIVVYSDDVADAMLALPSAMLADHESITLHDDLQDCNVDICSPQVLWRFNENFDYLELRKGFVASEVANLDLGQHIFAEVISSGSAYSARAHDPKCLDAIAHDLLHRWVYPIVPELNVSMGTKFRRTYVASSKTLSVSPSSLSSSSSSLSSFAMGSGGSAGVGGPRSLLYKDSGVVVPRSAVVTGGVLIGANTKVGEGVLLKQSTVGSACRLEDGCRVSGSHLWNDVVIEAGAVVEHSIVCNGAVVKAGAVVKRGCVLSFGVVVGCGVVVAPFTRLTLSNAKDDDDDAFGDDDDDDDEDDDEKVGGTPSGCGEGEGSAALMMGLTPEVVSDVKVVGVDGKGKVWRSEDDGDDDDDEEEDEEEGDEDDGGGGSGWGSATGGGGGCGGGGDEDDDGDEDEVAALAAKLRSLKGRAMGAHEHQEMAAWRHCNWTVELSDDEEEDEEDSSSSDEDEDDEEENAREDAKEAAGGGAEGGGAPSCGAGGVSEAAAKGFVGGAPNSGGSGSGGAAATSPTALFEKAVSDILVTGWEKKDQVESLLLEVNCFKLAQNKTFEHCLAGCAIALLTLACPPLGGGGSTPSAAGGAKAFLGSLKQQLGHWAHMLGKLTQGTSEEAAFVAAVESCLLSGTNASAAAAASSPSSSSSPATSSAAAGGGGVGGGGLGVDQFLSSVVAPHFAVVLKLMYDEETVTDEGILLWAANRRTDLSNGTVSAGTPSQRLFEQSSTQKFLEWLEEEDEESDEDDDDDEDEDE